MQSFAWRRHGPSGTLHAQPTTEVCDSSLSGSCVLLSMWHLMVRIIPRICITAFSMSPFDSLSPITASSVASSAMHSHRISESISCRFCVAFQCDFAVSKLVDELWPLTCSWFFDSLLQRNAAHDVLVSVFFYHNARSCIVLREFTAGCILMK